MVQFHNFQYPSKGVTILWKTQKNKTKIKRCTKDNFHIKGEVIIRIYWLSHTQMLEMTKSNQLFPFSFFLFFRLKSSQYNISLAKVSYTHMHACRSECFRKLNAKFQRGRIMVGLLAIMMRKFWLYLGSQANICQV